MRARWHYPAPTFGVVNEHGYRRVRCPSWPFARRQGKIYEHVLVVEARLGREMAPHENVHHRDGDKLHNLDANLAVVIRGPHQRGHTLKMKRNALGHFLKRGARA